MNHSNINEYTKDKLDNEYTSKSISTLEDFIFNYQDKLDEKKQELELLNKLNNLKRFN